MSILSEQLYAGRLNKAAEDSDTEMMRDPYGKNASDSEAVVIAFKGFSYAKDTEQASAFDTDVERNAPSVGSELFQTTTYGTAGSFAKLSDTDNTVLTDMAKFVDNGSGAVVGNEDEDDTDASDEDKSWGNLLMRNSFSTGNGTTSQTFRAETGLSEYDITTGWRNELLGNGFDAGHMYEVKNVTIDQVTPEEASTGTLQKTIFVEGVGEVTLSDNNQDGKVDFEDFFALADTFAETNE